MNILARMRYFPVFLLLAFALTGCNEPEPKQEPKRFEYKIEFINDYTWTSEMNAEGRNGWQVVGSRRASSNSTDDYGYEIIFMREILN